MSPSEIYRVFRVRDNPAASSRKYIEITVRMVRLFRRRRRRRRRAREIPGRSGGEKTSHPAAAAAAAARAVALPTGTFERPRAGSSQGRRRGRVLYRGGIARRRRGMFSQRRDVTERERERSITSRARAILAFYLRGRRACGTRTRKTRGKSDGGIIPRYLGGKKGTTVRHGAGSACGSGEVSPRCRSR